jgi:hypothetical protein
MTQQQFKLQIICAVVTGVKTKQENMRHKINICYEGFKLHRR